MNYSSPLRYPGGKGKLTNFIKLVMQENDLFDAHYVEPFAGGAGVALSLLFHEYVLHVHINDLNRSIYSFWFSVLNCTEDLCRLISDTPVTVEEWRKQRAIQNSEEVSPLELGFSTFYLNRTNRSGIISGGIIGGYDQTGKWKIDARYKKEDLIQRINKIASYRSRITIYNLDAAKLLLEVTPQLPQKTLTYLDPPYYVKGKDLYQNHYQHDDHEQLAEIVKNLTATNWIVSYDFVPQIAAIYKEYRQIDYQLNYSAAEKCKGSELMIFDDYLNIPDCSNPSSIKVA